MTDHQFSFEKLEVWKMARTLARNVYIFTRSFPHEEKFGLTQQMRRAAVSVCSNLAEGTTRLTPRDQAHFTVIAFSSLMELFNHSLIATDLGYLDETLLDNIRKQIQPLSARLSNLKKAQLSRMN